MALCPCPGRSKCRTYLGSVCQVGLGAMGVFMEPSYSCLSSSCPNGFPLVCFWVPAWRSGRAAPLLPHGRSQQGQAHAETRRFSESPGTRARPTGSLPRGTGQWPQTCPHQCLTLPHVWPELMPRETIVPTSFSMTRTVPEGRQQQASVPLPAGAHIPSALCVPHVSSVQAETLDPRLWSVWTSG